MNTNNKKNIVIKIGTTSIIKNDKVDLTLLKSLAELIIENKNQFNYNNYYLEIFILLSGILLIFVILKFSLSLSKKSVSERPFKSLITLL